MSRYLDQSLASSGPQVACGSATDIATSRPLFRLAPACVSDLSSTDLGHLTALIFAMPMLEENGRTAVGRWYGYGFHGRATLGLVLDRSERTVSGFIGKLNEIQGVTVKLRQRADHSTAFEIEYRLHRNRKMQIPAVLATIPTPAARGNSVKVYAHLQACPPWERTRNDIADSIGITRKATAAALTDLRRLDLIDRNHDPEPGKVRRPDAVQYASDKTCTSRVTNPAISRDERRFERLPAYNPAFPLHVVRETVTGEEVSISGVGGIDEDGSRETDRTGFLDRSVVEPNISAIGGETTQQPVRGSGDRRLEAKAVAGRLLDRSPVTDTKYARIVNRIVELLRCGVEADVITFGVDQFDRRHGTLLLADNPASVLLWRLENFDPFVYSNRRWAAGLEPVGVVDREAVLRRQAPDPHQRPKITNPDAIAAILADELAGNPTADLADLRTKLERMDPDAVEAISVNTPPPLRPPPPRVQFKTLTPPVRRSHRVVGNKRPVTASQRKIAAAYAQMKADGS